MTAGIPGTGITAIFYVLLVLMMPVHELFRTFRRQSRWKRWRQIAALNAMVYLGAGLMWIEGWLLAIWIQKPAAGAVSSSGILHSVATRNILSVQPLKAALIALLAVIMMVQMARGIRWLLPRLAALTNLQDAEKV